jgi:ProP effector
MMKLNPTETLATITMLATRWPQAFWVLETRRRPLKVGIHLDVMAAGGFSKPELRAALRAYTINVAYRRSLAARAERIGLDGGAAGWVTPEQAAGAAREQNDRFFRNARQRMQAKKADVTSLQHSAAVPAAKAKYPQPSVAAKQWPLLRLPK